MHRKTYSKGEVIKLMLAQEVSFLNKASIKSQLKKLPENSDVVIDASETQYIDFDVLDLIRDFYTKGASDKNIRVSLVGFKESYNLPKQAEADELEYEIAEGNEASVRP